MTEDQSPFTIKSFIRKLRWLLIPILILSVLWPQSFSDIMPGFDPSQTTRCEVSYFTTEVKDGVPVSVIQTRSFDSNSKDYQQLIKLLNSTSYRPHITNLIIGGALNSYSVTLDPYAEIDFYQGKNHYTYSLLGANVPAGLMNDKNDYSPGGGRKFQEQVISYIGEHGILTDESRF